MTLIPPFSSGPEQLPVDPGPTWLDEDHVLEPVAESEPDDAPAHAPIVVDATGRMWRMRYRPAWTGTLARAAPFLLGALLMVLLLVLRV